MKQKRNKKKIILGLALISAVAVAGIQSAGASPRGGGAYGWGNSECDGNCGGLGYGYSRQQLSEESLKARDKFMNDTVQLRKEMTTKQAEKRALMIGDNPDAKRVSQLTGEIFDIREQLKTKADESGIENIGFKGMGYGPGQRTGRGQRQGRGCNGPGGYFQNQL